MKDEVNVLIVGKEPARFRCWAAWLEEAGCNVLICPGPRLTWDCPRLDGEPCPRRELADVAVVRVPIDGWGEEALCTRVPDDGTTVLLADSDILPVLPGEVELSEPTLALTIGAVRNALRRRDLPFRP